MKRHGVTRLHHGVTRLRHGVTRLRHEVTQSNCNNNMNFDVVKDTCLQIYHYVKYQLDILFLKVTRVFPMSQHNSKWLPK